MRGSNEHRVCVCVSRGLLVLDTMGPWHESLSLFLISVGPAYYARRKKRKDDVYMGPASWRTKRPAAAWNRGKIEHVRNPEASRRLPHATVGLPSTFPLPFFLALLSSFLPVEVSTKSKTFERTEPAFVSQHRSKRPGIAETWKKKKRKER